MILDSCLRWGALALESRDFIPPWLYWVAQFLIIPIIVVPTAEHRRESIKKRENRETLRVQFDPASITFLVVVWAIGAYFSFVLPSLRWEWLEVVAGIVLSLLFAGYLSGLADMSIGPRVPAEEELEVFLPQDENDRRIAHLETNRAVLFQRVDTYTLEGTFLGAISFSAFVTILSEHADATVTPLVNAFENFVLAVATAGWEATAANDALGAVRSTEPLLASIAGETLLCSACFLTVLIARIRFMYAIQNADYCIRLASMMNGKEEDMVNLGLTAATAKQRDEMEERLSSIRKNIDDATQLARNALERLRPLILYMSVFRTLGLLFFLLTLVTGALWFSRVMALVVAVICLVAYLFPFLYRFFHDRASRALPKHLRKLGAQLRRD